MQFSRKYKTCINYKMHLCCVNTFKTNSLTVILIISFLFFFKLEIMQAISERFKHIYLNQTV